LPTIKNHIFFRIATAASAWTIIIKTIFFTDSFVVKNCTVCSTEDPTSVSNKIKFYRLFMFPVFIGLRKVIENTIDSGLRTLTSSGSNLKSFGGFSEASQRPFGALTENTQRPFRGLTGNSLRTIGGLSESNERPVGGLYRRLIYVSPWVTVSSSSPAKSF
jgi:hypothetical protein